MRTPININGFTYYVEDIKGEIVLFESPTAKHGVGLYSLHVTKDERKQVLEKLKYDKTNLLCHK